MERQMNKNRGFSLIELLIAVTILSIVMIMVTQFMSTTSGAATKTKKNLNIQTEAMEIGEQLSDALMQATYIRVRTEDNKLYKLDTKLDGTKRKRTTTDAGNLKTKTDENCDLVVDNYPNYLKNGVNDRKIILTDDCDLSDGGTATYPLTGDEDPQPVKSFRFLTNGKAAGEQLYVKPQYIYLQYQKKDGAAYEDAYVIYYFTGNEIYMDRGKMSALADGTTGFIKADGFDAAKAKVDTEKNLLTKLMSSSTESAEVGCYFSADTEANTVFLDMRFEDEKYKGYSYNYVEAVMLRNTNVLTVPPQKLYKKTTTP